MFDLDYCRCLSTEGLLEAARECGIDPGMAVALAERLEYVSNGYYSSYPAMGGRYTFNHRSKA